MFSLRKVVSILLTVVMLFLLTGCLGGRGFLEDDDFLAPPKPSGEMLYIKETLESAVTGKFSLKYPTAGEYRSAYIMCDLMTSGKENFALAFYSMIDEENVTSMHLNLMKKVDSAWVSISDVSLAALGVEKLQILDLNGDGIKEIIVGWNIYGDVDKSVTVYTLKGLALAPILSEDYSDFICFDMEQNGKANLFVLRHNPSEGKADAKLFAFLDDKVVNKGSCLLDGQVTSFYTPVVSTLSNGKPAIFLDAAKGTGTQTEVVFLKNGILERGNFENEESTTLSTYRNSSVLCNDINVDGKYDIPLGDSSLIFHPEEYKKTSAPMIKWSSFNGSAFDISTFAAMNYTDGYYLEIPVRWYGKITVDSVVDARTYTVSIWETEKSNLVGEILKIRTVTESEWDADNNGFSNYFEVVRSENLVYIAAIGNYTGTEKVSVDEVKKLVHIIK